jgi:hypothetical protein
MGAQGSATLDFGAFPGSNYASVDVAAAGVISTSAVEAWIRPATTTDHTDGDHLAARIRVIGVYLSDGNIRIHGFNENDVQPPLEPFPPLDGGPTNIVARPSGYLGRQRAPMLVGQYSVWWVWN